MQSGNFLGSALFHSVFSGIFCHYIDSITEIAFHLKLTVKKNFISISPRSSLLRLEFTTKRSQIHLNFFEASSQNSCKPLKFTKSTFQLLSISSRLLTNSPQKFFLQPPIFHLLFQLNNELGDSMTVACAF
jgi:hypothetical protein